MKRWQQRLDSLGGNQVPEIEPLTRKQSLHLLIPSSLAMLWDTIQAYSKHVRPSTNDTSLPVFDRRTLQQHDLSNTRELLFKLLALILISLSGLVMLGMLIAIFWKAFPYWVGWKQPH